MPVRKTPERVPPSQPRSPANPPARKPVAVSAADARGPAPVPKFRLRVAVGDVIAIGPGKVALLEAIHTTGSITAAAKSLQMSYRRAWLLLDELNRALREPAVASSHGGLSGGGSVLTATGTEVVALYRRIETTAGRACRADLDRLVQLASRA